MKKSHEHSHKLDYRTLPEGLRLAGRKEAVRLVNEDGMKLSHVADMFGTTFGTIKAWVKASESGDLSLKKRGRKPSTDHTTEDV